MKIILIIIGLLLLPMVAGGTIRTLESADLPYTTVANGDTLQFTGTLVVTGGAGVTISHDNIFIDGQGDTLKIGTTNSVTGYNGFYVNDSACTIRDLIIWQEDTSSFANGIRLTHNAINLSVINCDIIVNGKKDTKCINSYGDGTLAYGVIIDSCHFWNYSTEFTNRQYYDGAAVLLELRNPNIPSGLFSAKILRSVVHISPHCGIVVFGKDTTTAGRLLKDLEIAYCSTHVDHQNTLYPTWDGVTGHSSANAFGIIVSYADGGTRIHDNYIGAGSSYGGSRGLMLEGIQSDPGDTAKVYNNTIDIHCGPDVNYAPARSNYVPAWAVRIRDIDNGTGRGLDFYNNDVTITIDTHSVVGDAYGYWATALSLSETRTHDGRMRFFNNRFVVEALNIRAESDGEAFRLTATPYDSTIKFNGNYWQGVSNILYLREGSGMQFDGDTLAFASNTNNAMTYEVGYWEYVCTAHVAVDVVHCSPALSTDITYTGTGDHGLTVTTPTDTDCSASDPGGSSNRSKRGMFNKIIGDYDEENSNYHDSCVTGYPSRCSYSVR